jgi:hypothetical protein
MANRNPTPAQGGAARTAQADLDRIQPPLPAFDGCAPPLRVRKGSPSSVHTLESNVTESTWEPLNKNDWGRLRQDAKDFPDFNRELHAHGVLDSFECPVPAAPGEIAFRHSHWAEKRAIVRAALERTGSSARVLERFDNCGADCWLYTHKKTGDVRIHASTCRNRWCDPCAVRRSRVMAGNIGDYMRERSEAMAKKNWTVHYMHVTLTLVSSNLPLTKQIDAIYRAFRHLRSYKVKIKVHPDDAKLSTVRWWDQYVRGGACSFEPMGKKKTKRFHPHLHCVVECRGRPFIPHWELKEAWRACTRRVNPKLESYIVHVSPITTFEAAANEVAKYASKGVAELATHFLHDKKKLDEMLVSMRGRRMLTTFGTWRGIALSSTPTFVADDWVNHGPYLALAAAAEAGNDRAARLIEIARAQITKAPRPPPVVSPN